jgi:anti-sigma B factor antagonist
MLLERAVFSPGRGRGGQMQFEAWTEEYKGFPVLCLSGELDTSTIEDLEGQIAEIVSAGDSFMLDIKGVTYMESTPIGLLVQARQHLQNEGATLALVCEHGNVERLFRMSGLARKFNLFGTRDEAVGFLSATV